jgi:peptidyl-prolyl cis-trans isomerase C
MNTSTSSSGGCGSGNCQCATTAAQSAGPVPSINGIALHAPGEQPDVQTLQELAYTELLRQQAVKTGLLQRSKGLSAPVLNDAERKVLEDMLDVAVTSPQPTEDECLRYYTANKAQFVVGQAVHVRHILFAVTPGVNVHALTVRAEKALIELLGKDVAPDRFGALAAELSNCPTSTQGGDLGWLQPHDCAPELANELFHQAQAGLGLGVHPRLIHTRFGFHIIQVLATRKGKQAPYEEVRERIAAQLTLQSRAKALHQYMSLLVGQSLVEGVHLERADSPLVQ